MLVEELHIFLEKFTQLCESNPNEYSLTFEEISDRQNKFNEWYNQLLEIEKEYTFPTIADEINYYKYQKSEFQKYGIYYDIIYDLELRRSPITLKYYKRKLKELDREFNEIEHYVVYYRSNAMDKDDLYFVKDSKCGLMKYVDSKNVENISQICKYEYKKNEKSILREL
jgi:hypothetical protein